MDKRPPKEFVDSKSRQRKSVRDLKLRNGKPLVRSFAQFGKKRSTALEDIVIEALAGGKMPAEAAALIGVSIRTLYQWKRDPEFDLRWREACETAVDLMEAEARRRAIVGVERPVFQGGQEVGRVREYSDNLLIMLMKGRRRDVFGDKTELTGGATIKLVVAKDDVNL